MSRSPIEIVLVVATLVLASLPGIMVATLPWWHP